MNYFLTYSSSSFSNLPAPELLNERNGPKIRRQGSLYLYQLQLEWEILLPYSSSYKVINQMPILFITCFNFPSIWQDILIYILTLEYVFCPNSNTNFIMHFY